MHILVISQYDSSASAIAGLKELRGLLPSLVVEYIGFSSLGRIFIVDVKDSVVSAPLEQLVCKCLQANVYLLTDPAK